MQNFLSTERDTSAADAWQAQELQAGLMAYYLGRKEGEEKINTGGSKGLAVPVKQDDPPNWWEKTVKFFYNARGQDLVEPATEQEILNSPDAATMKTYIATAINVQRGASNNPFDDNAGNGPAQLSRAQLNTPYGEGFECKNGECRGYGLGLPGADPFDDNTAVQGMNNRIQQVLEEADKQARKNGITVGETDKFIIAAMAQNGGGFDLNDIQIVMKRYTEDGRIDWDKYYVAKQAEWDKPANFWKKVGFLFPTGGAAYDTQYMLERFYDEASALHESGYYLPENLDTNKIESLINGNTESGD